MSINAKHIDQFKQRGIDYFQKKMDNALSNFRDNLKLVKQYISSKDDYFAMSEWVAVDKTKTPSCLVAPAEMRFGDLKLFDSKGAPVKNVNIPLLLPMNTNAVMVNCGTEAVKVTDLFQNIILRLLLSMRMDLVKVSVVDMDFGASFPVVSAINNPMFKSQVVYSQEDVAKLMSQLGREISEANRNCLGRHPNLDSYNASSGVMAQPYHFVFIDDFPNGFTQQSIDELLRMIDGGNAAKAGVKFFINYSVKNPAPRDFDIKSFESCCSWINRDVNGRFTFGNYPIKFPARTEPIIELEKTTRAQEYVDYINEIKPQSITYTLDGWIEEMKKNNQIWSGSTIDGIKIPVGFITPTKMFDFYIANDKDSLCRDYFALIAGRPGYGKTVLLHNIIVNSAMKYSPDELCFYLADFADGSGFGIYKDLPHVKALMAANNREYALRMLEDIALEAKKRSTLYKQAQKKYGKKVDDLSSYREVSGEKLPRILFVMDEFHVLFISVDDTTMRAKQELCNGIRQWRKFGISVVLSTQSISDVNFGDADNNITYRFALNLLGVDSKTVIHNDAAKLLTRKGQTIMNNTSDGNEQMNVEFQSAYTSHNIDHVKYLADYYYHVYKKKHTPFICEEGVDADIADYAALTSLITTGSVGDFNYCDVYVGRPDLLREEHTSLRYRRQEGSNTLIIGDDLKTLVYNIMVQLIQLRNQSMPGSKFYLIDCFNVGDKYSGAFDGMSELPGNFKVGYSRDTSKYIDEVFSEFERRKKEQSEGDLSEESKNRIVVTILNTQSNPALKPQQGEVGRRPSETTKKLVTMLTEGAPLGIHFIIHGLSILSLFKSSGILNDNHISLFENYVFMTGSDSNEVFSGSKRVGAPQENGQIVVIDRGQPYEQCTVYSEFTTQKKDSTIAFMTKMFEKYRYE